MTSTRNQNQPYDYACKKKGIERQSSYWLNHVFAEPKQAVHSFVLGANPTKLNASSLSYNAIDVESSLRGIRSCNLEGESFQATMKPKHYYTAELFDNHLHDHIFVPRPFYHETHQRAGFHNI